MKTDLKSLADIEFQLRSKSYHGNHTDCLFARRVNLWRDIFPKPLSDELMNRSVGDIVEVAFKPGEVLQMADPAKLFTLKRSQFDETFRPGAIIQPRQGRFYPRGILQGLANVFRANLEPFRCAEVNGSSILVDLSHPLAGFPLNLKAIIRAVEDRRLEKGGGMCNDWMETVANGPGMQVRWNGRPTDFLSDGPFERDDRTPDGTFYQKPRFVEHIDSLAIENISGLYEKALRPGDNVLDLMAGWKSHIPPRLTLKGVAGLGMNREELKKNQQLTDYLVHDLNENPLLPFADDSFDSVICTVSVEYLTNPLAVFREVGRVLKQGGPFILAFSNRWFPPKVIAIWKDIYEFERVGLVAEYFLLSERFENLHTHSMRGLPRPREDKYYGDVLLSDPVYAVWAYKA
jgi:FKBP-type peptidyl-prolyl cis-trans isomerase 2